MVDGLNAVEIAVGGVAGAAFGSIFDGITEVLRNAAEFTTSHTNIKSTLEALQPLIREIEGKNKRLLLQDEELKDLKKEIEAGVKRVQEFSERSVWNYCKRPFYNKELDGMDKSLKRLLRILQVQGVRDVKEVLVQVNDCKTDVNKISIQLDDCTTEIVEGISAWKIRTTGQLDQVARNGKEILDLTRRMIDQFERINGPSSSVPISEKVASLVQEEALGSSLLTMRHAVDEALSKPNPHYNIFRIEVALRRAVEELGDADVNRKLEEGTELIRKCSNVVEWTDRKMVKYANKLDDLVKFLEAFGQRLKRNNITMPKGFDTQNSIPCITYSVDYGENQTEIENEMPIFKKSNRPTDDVNGLRNDGKIGHHDSSVSGYSSFFAATSNFAEENKLGEGGFGPVYKGKLAMGQKKAVKWHRMLFFKKSNRPTDGVNGLRNDGKIGHHDSSVFSYSSILAATSNFAEENMIGQGGFGPVYKGKLAMGQEIAVKRLSKYSGQGLSEFKNELILNELQHTNLVHLFGFCIHGEEKMLIYEYMQNKSLEHFLFDPTRGRLLDWKKRFSIIEGIAQGLLYLHKYSRKKVIHRDIKASNILLDENMNPKISDFGLARILTQNGLEANTIRIVGTMSYMAPENILEGIISVKSDVFSFGVLMLQIISGRRNNRFYNDRPLNLVPYAWELWKEGAGLELMDPILGNSFIKEQLLRCIHVGLLCVQDNAADRPTMSDVICMLINESLPLASPTKPAFCVGKRTAESQTGINMSQQLEMESQTGINWSQQSANYMSSSDFEAR